MLFYFKKAKIENKWGLTSSSLSPTSSTPRGLYGGICLLEIKWKGQTDK